MKFNYQFIDIKTDEYGGEYFVWPGAPRSRIYGGVISGGVISGSARISGGEHKGTEITSIVSHLQYNITIDLSCSHAQIGCHYKSLADWMDVSLEEAKRLGLNEINYEPIRNLLRKFMD